MREQIAQQPPIKRRASAVAASPHPAGFAVGIHPEDQPYQSDDYELADESYYTTRLPNSARRYFDPRGNQIIQRGNQRIVIHEGLPPKRHIHWLLILGLGMLLMLSLWLGLGWLMNWWTNRQADAAYGFPRTFQTDAVVYPGDSAEHPSHYIFLNLKGVAEIIELPQGDSAHARIYKGPQLFSDNAASIPVTGEFRTVNGTVEMLVHIQNRVIVYVNDGTQFKPQ